MRILKEKIVLLGLLIPVLGLLLTVKVQAQETGTISATNRYAWSENLGWIDFGTTEGDVTITDSALTGYAWGENIGWISLNCSNTSSCTTSNYKVSNNSEGDLSGYAWSENMGWIDFDPANGGVTISDDGDFSGSAWGENTGWIIFNCTTTSSCATVSYKVYTNWRPASVRTPPASPPPAAPSGGGGGGGSPTSYRPGDANKDNKIDLLDFNILMINWGSINTDPYSKNIADFNSDNKVDLLDFNILMVNWTG